MSSVIFCSSFIVEGVSRAGGVRDTGEEGAGSGIPKVMGRGKNRRKLRNIAQYFAIGKTQRGGSQQKQGGNRDSRYGKRPAYWLLLHNLCGDQKIGDKSKT